MHRCIKAKRLKSVKNGKKKNVDNGTVSTYDFFKCETKIKCINVEFVNLHKNYTCETCETNMLEIKRNLIKFTILLFCWT